MRRTNEVRRLPQPWESVCVVALAAICVVALGSEAEASDQASRGCAGRAHLPRGPVLAQALAQSMEHAAGDGPVRGTEERPRLVFESWGATPTAMKSAEAITRRGLTAASADPRSSSWIRKATWSVRGAAPATFPSGPPLCRPSSWTGRATSGSAEPRRKTASSNFRMMESCFGISTTARRKVRRRSRRTISRPTSWCPRDVLISTRTPTRFT